MADAQFAASVDQPPGHDTTVCFDTLTALLAVHFVPSSLMAPFDFTFPIGAPDGAHEGVFINPRANGNAECSHTGLT